MSKINEKKAKIIYIILIVAMAIIIAVTVTPKKRLEYPDFPDFNEPSYGDFTIIAERSGIRGNKILELVDDEGFTYTMLTDSEYNPISITKNN